MYKISYIERFKKEFNKLSNNELALFQNMIRLFIEDVLQSSLKTKKRSNVKKNFMKVVKLIYYIIF